MLNEVLKVDPNPISLVSFEEEIRRLANLTNILSWEEIQTVRTNQEHQISLTLRVSWMAENK